MSENGSSIIDQLIRKLGLQREDKITDKTTELLRLFEIKSPSGCTINEYAKIIICIDLATVQLGISFDSQIALKLSGLRRTIYEKYRRTFEKILELNRPLGINEICIQLGLSESQKKKATQFLETYRNKMNENSDEIDFAHPQYAAMAVHQVCRLPENGKKSIKSKLIALSHLKPVQWNKLEQQWDKLLQDQLDDGKGGAIVKKLDRRQDSVGNGDGSKAISRKPKFGEPHSEDYEAWKKRMLDYAYAKLKELEGNDL